MRAYWIASLVGLGCLSAAGASFVACANAGSCDFGECLPLADGGGGDGGTTWPEGCEPEKEAKDSPKCLDETVAVFVSVSGNDESGDGSRTKPVKSFTKALSIRKGKPRIYACEGTYEGPVDLEGVTNYGGIFGGWSCDGSWSYNGKHAVIHAAGAVGLRVRNGQSITAADVDIAVDDATAKGGSSVAGLFANSSIAVRRSSFTAGKGQPAEDRLADGGNFPPSTDLNGNPGTADAGGAARTNLACTSSGGRGGAPATNGNAGTDGTPNYDPSIPDGSIGKGQTVAECQGGDARHVIGSHGPGGAFGPSASTYGSLTAEAFAPAAGQPGQPGGAGQGGGGGASTNESGGGGGGGAGGCGGTGGLGGGGGGSSIALALLNATVNIDADSRFSAKEAGKGGNGGGGQQAQSGGSRGNATGTTGCNGGNAGSGGSGGGGGGGAGGISVGILWSGEAPSINGAPVQDSPSLDGFTVSTSVAPGGTRGGGGLPAVTSPPPGSPPGGTPPENGKSGVARAVVKL